MNLFYLVNKFFEKLFMTNQLSLKGKYFSLYTFNWNVLVAFHSCVTSDIISFIPITAYGCLCQKTSFAA